MRYIYSTPLMLLPVLLFTLVASTDIFSATMMDMESLIVDQVLPSGAEFFFKAGEGLVAFNILLLPLSVARSFGCAAIAPSTLLATAACTLLALLEFLFLPSCGSASFLFLMMLALAEALIAGVAFWHFRRLEVRLSDD